MHFTLEECDEWLASFQFSRDVRKPPDGLRSGRFRQGWRDAAVRNKDYKTLQRLAWQNLGFRLGERLGDASDAEIDEAYSCFAEHYRLRGRIIR